MSPWSIVVETFRVTLKPLSMLAVVMAVIMLLPDSGIAMGFEPASAATVTTTLVALDISTLPPSAFGDHDESGR